MLRLMFRGAAVFLLFCLLPIQGWAQSGVTVSDLRLGREGSKTRIVLDVTGAVPYRAFTLNDPPRMVVDLPVVEWRAPMNKGDRNAIVKSYRQGIYNNDTRRVVFDLNRPAVIAEHMRLPPDRGRPWRYVVDLKPVDPITFRQQAHRAVTGGGATQTATRNLDDDTVKPLALPDVAASPQTPTLTDHSADRKPLIVLDAGHGGVDPGAFSSTGYHEKNITLAAAREVKRQLEMTGRYRVKMTRDRDIYIKLPDRVAIARRAGADLFVSLHADTIGRPTVQGASVYTLSKTASDAETAKLAERENAVDTLVNVDVGADVDADIQDILIDLVTRDTMNQSKALAETVVGTFRANGVAMLPQRPHRSAGFAVLKAPDIPSILIEMGYLSNRSEAARLASTAHREKIARAVVQTIDRFFSQTRKE
jgi:N-acetylmuramoyl-L-alanine amidase